MKDALERFKRLAQDERGDLCKKAVEAVEKQVPKKIELFNGQCSCPNCKRLFGNYSQLRNLICWEMSYCKYCGQALDWRSMYKNDKRR